MGKESQASIQNILDECDQIQSKIINTTANHLQLENIPFKDLLRESAYTNLDYSQKADTKSSYSPVESHIRLMNDLAKSTFKDAAAYQNNPKVAAKLKETQELLNSLQDPKKREDFYKKGFKDYADMALTKMIVNNLNIEDNNQKNKAIDAVLKSVKNANLPLKNFYDNYIHTLSEHNVSKNYQTILPELKPYISQIKDSLNWKDPINPDIIKKIAGNSLEKMHKEHGLKDQVSRLTDKISNSLNYTKQSKGKVVDLINKICKESKIENLNPTITDLIIKRIKENSAIKEQDENGKPIRHLTSESIKRIEKDLINDVKELKGQSPESLSNKMTKALGLNKESAGKLTNLIHKICEENHIAEIDKNTANIIEKHVKENASKVKSKGVGSKSSMNIDTLAVDLIEHKVQNEIKAQHEVKAKVGNPLKPKAEPEKQTETAKQNARPVNRSRRNSTNQNLDSDTMRKALEEFKTEPKKPSINTNTRNTANATSKQTPTRNF